MTTTADKTPAPSALTAMVSSAMAFGLPDICVNRHIDDPRPDWRLRPGWRLRISDQPRHTPLSGRPRASVTLKAHITSDNDVVYEIQASGLGDEIAALYHDTRPTEIPGDQISKVTFDLMNRLVQTPVARARGNATGGHPLPVVLATKKALDHGYAVFAQTQINDPDIRVQVGYTLTQSRLERPSDHQIMALIDRPIGTDWADDPVDVSIVSAGSSAHPHHNADDLYRTSDLDELAALILTDCP